MLVANIIHYVYLKLSTNSKMLSRSRFWTPDSMQSTVILDVYGHAVLRAHYQKLTTMQCFKLRPQGEIEEQVCMIKLP